MASMDYDLADFKASQLGIQVAVVLACPANQAMMTELSRQGLPAIQAIGKALLRLDYNVSSAEAKHFISRWVREEMATKGLFPAGIRRVETGNLFPTGVLYARKASD